MPQPTLEIRVAGQPSLQIAAFTTRFPAPLGELVTPREVVGLLRPEAAGPLVRDETVRVAVRDLLRQGGYRPSGRGKPASEYLVRAAEEGSLAPINLAVDACNAVSLHSGFPIGVADLGLARPPFRIEAAPAGTSYVFNPAGQEIAFGGLLCLCDAAGPCINPVRDSQRTKTRPETVETLSVVWAPAELAERLRRAEKWYRALLESAGATTADVSVATAGDE